MDSALEACAANPGNVELHKPDINLQKRYDELRESSLRDLEKYSSFYESYRELWVKHNELLRKKRPVGNVEEVKDKVSQIKEISTQPRVKSLCEGLLEDLERSASYSEDLEKAQLRIASLERQLASQKRL